MPRGHNKKIGPSKAKKEASKKPRASHGKPTAKPTTIVDDRPSQRIAPKRLEKAPDWAVLTKSQHESIPGTRIQSLPGGVAVRVVTEDGAKFPPHKVAAVKKHLKKLVQKAKEKAEVEQMINGTKPVPDADADDKSAESRAHAKSRKRVAPAATPPKSKKERKEEAWKARQQQLQEAHAEKIKEEGRELVSDQWCAGEVVQRAQGLAWAKVRDPSQIPEAVLTRLRDSTEEIRRQLESLVEDVIPIRFADVDKSLDLKPGIALRFQVYTDRNGVGGCNASAAA
mmetsp:Transcript_84753/g.133408  ORF Transcript_84753/g.133408 Transcript_84753/m.133408 type:complete len:283 (+) Transcript_84753:45-893(+)